MFCEIAAQTSPSSSSSPVTGEAFRNEASQVEPRGRAELCWAEEEPDALNMCQVSPRVSLAN